MSERPEKKPDGFILVSLRPFDNFSSPYRPCPDFGYSKKNGAPHVRNPERKKKMEKTQTAQAMRSFFTARISICLTVSVDTPRLVLSSRSVEGC